MKYLLKTFVLAFLVGMGALHAQSIWVSGTITDSLNGSPVPSYPVQVSVYDSTNLILMTTTFQTDSIGTYNFPISTANGPASGWLEVSVVDCNGQIQFLHLIYTGGNATYSGIDFQICAPTATCTAGFAASVLPGNSTVGFLDLSMTNYGSVNSWLWDFGDGNTASGLNIAHTYANPGTYLVCLNITTTTGCSATFCDSVNTLGGAACSATLAYTTQPNGSMAFVATGSGTGLPVQYTYDFGDGNSLTTSQATVSYTYVNGGAYTACVTVLFSDSCTATACTPAGNGGPCQADFYSMPDTTGQYSLLLVNNSTGAGLSYFWDFGDGGTSTQAYPQHTFPGAGTYYICLSITDSANTCASSFCDSITVTQKQAAAFTIQVVPALPATGTPDPAADILTEVRIHPNPVTEVLSVELNLRHRRTVQFQLIDLNGRMVKAMDAGTLPAGIQHFEMEVRDIPAGLYLLCIDGMSSSKRLAIVH